MRKRFRLDAVQPAEERVLHDIDEMLHTSASAALFLIVGSLFLRSCQGPQHYQVGPLSHSHVAQQVFFQDDLVFNLLSFARQMRCSDSLAAP